MPVAAVSKNAFPGSAARARPRRIIAVGGGKGGIGKSLLSANLGVALAREGARVLLVDGDLGGANLHTCLGMPPPSVTLSDFVQRRVATLEEAQVSSGVENLRVIAGAQDVLDAANMRYPQKQKLIRSLLATDVDYLVLDLGAGTSFNTLDFFLVADIGVLVLLPEPTSVENAYRFVKAAFFRRLLNVGMEMGVADLVEDALSTRDGNSLTPFTFISRVKRQNPEAGAAMERELTTFRVQLVVNQVRTGADAHVAQAVASAWKKFFGLEMEPIGSIPYDDDAWRAVRKRRPLLLESPDSPAARSITEVARRLLTLPGPPSAGP
ncbi:MAG: P-loop NTPase [Myxococcaceae bacterium]|nr:P-loop NTPase [Myxococcaceae bacterium]MCI0670027.1 P-loop NTPase [Myxococcaceae bacterium]